jgi:hypothetical protein
MFAAMHIRRSTAAIGSQRFGENMATDLPMPGGRCRLPTFVLALTAAAARSTVCLWTGFIDVECSTVKVGTIQSGDSPVPFSVVAHFHESKPSGLSRMTVGHNADTINCAVCCEHGSNRILGSTEAEVSHKNIFHFYFQDRTRAVGPNYRKMPKFTDC